MEMKFTEEQMAAKDAARKELIAKQGAILAKAVQGKRKLLDLGKRKGIMRCHCGAEGRTLRVSLSNHANRHMRAHCSACNFWMME